MAADDLCRICGERVVAFAFAPTTASATPERPLCGLCQRATPAYECATAFAAYDGALRELLHLFKYGNVEPAAAILGKLMAQAIERWPAEYRRSRPIMVPVPLHRERLAQRGFNQSELIARIAAKRLGLKLETGVLIRKRATSSQTGLTNHQRRANLRGAFATERRERIAGREILLVDDVMTTGATAAECARVLRRSGAKNVRVATVARVHKTSMGGREENSLEEIATPRQMAAGAVQ